MFQIIEGLLSGVGRCMEGELALTIYSSIRGSTSCVGCCTQDELESTNFYALLALKFL